jgi:hypothetical protein
VDEVLNSSGGDGLRVPVVALEFPMGRRESCRGWCRERDKILSIGATKQGCLFQRGQILGIVGSVCPILLWALVG